MMKRCTHLYVIILSSLALGGTSFSNVALASSTNKIGVVGSMSGNVTATGSGGAARSLKAGSPVYLNDVILSSANSKAQIMFLDKSALMVNANTKVTVDRFIFNPSTAGGDLSINAAKGALRFIGGALSKKKPVQIKTPVATIGIRGGIADAHVGAKGATETVFVFGEELTMTNGQGQTQRLTTPGQGLTLANAHSVPVPLPPQRAAQLMSSFGGNPATEPASTSGGDAVNTPEANQDDNPTPANENEGHDDGGDAAHDGGDPEAKHNDRGPRDRRGGRHEGDRGHAAGEHPNGEGDHADNPKAKRNSPGGPAPRPRHMLAGNHQEGGPDAEHDGEYLGGPDGKPHPNAMAGNHAAPIDGPNGKPNREAHSGEFIGHAPAIHDGPTPFAGDNEHGGFGDASYADHGADDFADGAYGDNEHGGFAATTPHDAGSIGFVEPNHGDEGHDGGYAPAPINIGNANAGHHDSIGNDFAGNAAEVHFTNEPLEIIPPVYEATQDNITTNALNSAGTTGVHCESCQFASWGQWNGGPANHVIFSGTHLGAPVTADRPFISGQVTKDLAANVSTQNLGEVDYVGTMSGSVLQGGHISEHTGSFTAGIDLNHRKLTDFNAEFADMNFGFEDKAHHISGTGVAGFQAPVHNLADGGNPADIYGSINGALFGPNGENIGGQFVVQDAVNGADGAGLFLGAQQ